MKFFLIPFNEIYFISHKSALSMAIEKENIDILHLLLSNSNIDPNVEIIINHLLYFIPFKNTFIFMLLKDYSLNKIQNSTDLM